MQLHPALSMCYVLGMTVKLLADAMTRAAAWPVAAQEELAGIALEIDAAMRGEVYHASPKELAGIDRGLDQAHQGRFAGEDAVGLLFDKHRPR